MSATTVLGDPEFDIRVEKRLRSNMKRKTAALSAPSPAGKTTLEGRKMDA